MKKNDVLLIIAVIIMGLIGLVFVRSYIGDSGEFVIAKDDGKEVLRADLSKDSEYKIVTENGFNIIKVHSGEVTVIDSDCKNKICVNHRPIRSTSESIICLPHKLIVEIEKEDSDSEVDSESK